MKCEACGKGPGLFPFQRHHKLSDTKKNRELYPDFIDDPRNIQRACAGCNVSHRGLGLIHYTEIEFCVIMNIIPRSKIGKQRWIDLGLELKDEKIK